MNTVRAEQLASGVRLVTLDRPPANALNEELLSDLGAALGVAAADGSVRAVVLTGAGRFFSGGFDFGAARRDDKAARAIQALYRDTHLSLLTLAKPTVAMVNGHAVAGGLVLVLACDYRLAIQGGDRVGLNEVGVGASFPKVAFEIVRLRLTNASAGKLILGAGLYPMSDALGLGVVDELLPRQGFEDEALRRAALLGSYPREAYAHAKAALVAEAAARVRDESEQEAELTAAVWSAPESRAARTAQRRKLGIER